MNKFNVVEVELSHAKELYDMAMHADVRSNAINPEKFSFESHVAWLEKKITDVDCKHFIVCNEEDKVIEQTRFDKDDEAIIIDYSVAADYRGKGLAGDLLEACIENLDVEWWNKVLKGIVKNDNPASAKVFIKLGFEENDHIEIKEVVYRVFTLQTPQAK